MRNQGNRRTPLSALRRTRTGINGLDDITEGGLPYGRPTLVCGGAGSCKTLLAVQFLVNGARMYHEPGILMSFEETDLEIRQNVASLGFDLAQLQKDKQLVTDCVRIDWSEMREAGDYNLEGLFVRLGNAIDSIRAKRVVIDSLETLFTGLANTSMLRTEFTRLFRWLKSKQVTAVITAERGEGSLTRFGLEEYVSDCVILLDHRLSNQIATRRLRVVKYRGARHAADEYPFMIGSEGITVLPITTIGLSHTTVDQRISSGVPRLDKMLGGKGYFRGSSILVSGTAGTGKTSIEANFIDAACRRGERCLVFLFEESPDQMVRNMRSIGLDLERWVAKGRLRFHATRPTFASLESHLENMHRMTQDFKPHIVAVDPITNLSTIGSLLEVRSVMTRLIDYFKCRQITAFFTSLAQKNELEESTDIGISSLMDTWILLRDIEHNGERNRALYILKSRGMAHSNQVREFRLTDHGIDLIDVYVGPGGVLTGTARLAQEARERAEEVVQREEFDKKRNQLAGRRLLLRAQIEAMRLELEQIEFERLKNESAEGTRRQQNAADRASMALARFADSKTRRAKRPIRKRG